MTPNQFLLSAARNERASVLTVRQLALLTAISDGRQFGTKELATHLGVPTPAVTRACKTMEIDGLVLNAKDRKDLRQRIIGITAAGKALLREINALPARVAP